MAQDDEPVYSRDEVVKEVTSFYELLIGLHIPESALKRPPPGGWPDINRERYAWLKKDDTVIDLMRHLPFIYREDHTEGHEIYTLTAAVDYNGPHVLDCMEREDTYNIEPEMELTKVPPYILTLATETSGGDGCWIFVNTKRGTVTLYEPTVGPQRGPFGKGTVENEPAEDSNDEDWREHSTWRVTEFFQLLREKFRSLELLPSDTWEVLPNYDREPDRKLVSIYKEYGWPSPISRQEECLEKVEQYMREYRKRLVMERNAERLQI